MSKVCTSDSLCMICGGSLDDHLEAVPEGPFDRHPHEFVGL